MTRIAFKRITPDESRIYNDDGDYVGDVFRQDDILNPGGHYYIVHLDEDWRGPHRVHERHRIGEVAHRGAQAMSRITFKRVTPHESRIYQGTDCVGDVYRQVDILNPGDALLRYPFG